MRLINIDTLELVSFAGKQPPPYNILSHRWTDDEPTCKEFRKGLRKDSLGYRKIQEFCATTRKISGNRIKWVWVDTVCIDQRSSAELSESINSMWDYYRKSNRCYVHLHDVHAAGALGRDWVAKSKMIAQFRQSKWFTRCWTLQELIAPFHLTFFTQDWQIIGSKYDATMSFSAETMLGAEELCSEISDITGVPFQVLRGHAALRDYSVAQRMSWASGRQASRLEDEAYSLLGIFDLNMPLIYGEGRRAFRRLQLEIIKISHDQSIFAWTLPETSDSTSWSWYMKGSPLLAESPAAFAGAGVIEKLPSTGEPYAVNNHGLELTATYDVLSSKPSEPTFDATVYIVPLNCVVRRDSTDESTQVCHILLARLGCGHYGRILSHSLPLCLPNPIYTGKFHIHITACEDDHRDTDPVRRYASWQEWNLALERQGVISQSDWTQYRDTPIARLMKSFPLQNDGEMKEVLA